MRKYQSDESRWLIDSKLIKIEGKKLKDHLSLSNDSSSSQSANGNSIRMVTLTPSTTSYSKIQGKGGAAVLLKQRMLLAKYEETNVHLHKIDCRVPRYWKPAVKRVFSKMKNKGNKSVASFVGATLMDSNLYVVFEYCSKGTLHYVLHTTKYNITNDIKYQFALDVAQGMTYLHHCGIIHGQLSSLTCYLDSSWMVKVSQWEQMFLYSKENRDQLKNITTYSTNNDFEEEDLIKFLYMDPNVSRCFNESVDVYSFGCLLAEIFSQKLPYMTEVENGSTSFGELLQKKFRNNVFLPIKDEYLPKKIVELSNACISKDYVRPNFQKIYQELKNMTKISSGIVDIILNALEQHAETLEEKVEERTAELKEVTHRMKVLLYEVLPPQIADQLFRGEPVLPEFYECVTIFFSDIVGFTSISARSNPAEVMTLLNDLWITFDNVIDQFDVYKVDTIGDAYMVCSGLPVRNGIEHCRHIADLSLALLESCCNFKIKHLPKEELKVRIGINSGPVTAGVVGLKLPQYCVFGDTVNTAARMESTSIEKRIQISYYTHQLIVNNFPDRFLLEFRGEISVKGKGSMQTYWLIGTTEW